MSSSESSSLSDISCDFFVGQTGAGGGPSGAFDMVVVRLGAGAGAGAREGACAVVVVGASPLELLMLVQARTRSWAGEQTVVVALQPQVRAMKLPQREHRPCLPAAEALSC